MLVKKYVTVIFLCLLLSFSTISLATQTQPSCIKLGSAPSLMVKLTGLYSNTAQPKGLSSINFRSLSHVANLKFISAYPMALGMYVMKFKPIINDNGCYPAHFIDQVSQKLITSQLATDVEPNLLLSTDESRPNVKPTIKLLPDLTPPGFNAVKQFDLAANTATGGIDALGAWDFSTGSTTAVVAVIDTGIQTNASLSPNLLSATAASFYNSGTVENNSTPRCIGSTHGTHVSGTVVSSGNGAYNENIYGVAYTGRVEPINIFSSDCLATTSDELDALDWVSGTSYAGLPAAPAVRVINMSFGGRASCLNSENTVFARLNSQGVSLVAAAGNDNLDVSGHFPANCNDVIPVAATNAINARRSSSNWGSDIEISAPGDSIYSTVTEGYATLSGTSMSAPHIAGVLALEYSVNSSLTPAQALAILKTDPTAPSAGCSAPTTCGVGIVNANAAVKEAADTAPPVAPVITTAARNPEQENQAWVSYSSAGTVSDEDTLAAVAFSGSTVTFESANNRFVINNITTTEATQFTIKVTNHNDESAASNQITLPAASTHLVAPVLTIAVRNPIQKNQAWVSYSSAGTVSSTDILSASAFPGSTVRYESANHRFVIDNIQTGKATPFTITVTNSQSISATSNQITLPGILR